ncbi:unnamed protein product [Brugia pahangi]|uniref:Ovule protein n=1 Tax=Brugia pahangi TaxID=6280 RepID=A0A0N4T8Y5_BRUPA|nr:unnamed protein product [Brugia pahangi]
MKKLKYFQYIILTEKSVGRRRGSSLRNGQTINVDSITKQSLSLIQPTKNVKEGTSTISNCEENMRK